MTDGGWIERRIAEARKGGPLVTQPVVERIEKILRGQLSERDLPKGELTGLAKILIAEMTAPPQGSEDGE